ncbi:splicing factor ESS-2 homolog isoform X1 [Choloepus didactylus]|uniref:splicing factor ESS-2 homolog isoform X1 n=1 Tax=Choloepus didactylus TaxID=27675 RepID=UPI00189C9F1F|nr:splicing factor ESS-2 homolog isoform X1 [Choloepus didactylus]
METPGASAGPLLLPEAPGPRRKRAAGAAEAVTGKQRVLDEEEYIEGLQTVIQRDFFPDVEKLQAQKEYLEAEENGDLERMRQIAIKFGSALGKMSREPPPPYVTPATFETPEVHTGPGTGGIKPRGRGRGLEEGDAGEEEGKEPLPSLDVFLSRYTSEDNASFQEVMEVAKEKSRARHAWLYQAEEEFEKRQKDNLMLPSAEHQAIESSQAGVETWKYKAKNSLMYYPEGEWAPPRGEACAAVGGGVCSGLWLSGPRPPRSRSASGGGGWLRVRSARERGPPQLARAPWLRRLSSPMPRLAWGDSAEGKGVAPLPQAAAPRRPLPPLPAPPGVPDEEQLFRKPRQVVHGNTRFLRDPFSQALSRSQLQQAAALNAQHKQGKVGPDGKELIPQEAPRVGGFGFVATPSPAPGVNESPLMTWGEVENTPLRVEGSETPYVDRTPGPAFKILEPGRRERLGLKMANEAAAKNRAKKQEALRRVTENLASLTPKGLSPAMSPALQRLVSRTASKYTDRALRASYTPSPSRPTHLKTPAGGPQTPTGTPAPGSATRTPLSQDPASITDNLLQLPARRKASDFF